MRDLICSLIISYYKFLIKQNSWHSLKKHNPTGNHVRYLTVLILTPTRFLQSQHFMSSCFSASSWQHDTWGMCAAGRSCASRRRTGDRRGAARSTRWTPPSAPAAPITVVIAGIITTKIIIIVTALSSWTTAARCTKWTPFELLYSLFLFWEPCTSSTCGHGQPGCRHSSLIHILYSFCKYNNQQCFCF